MVAFFSHKHRVRHLGHISLGIAVGGLVSLEIALQLHWLEAAGWRILANGFEAATVGGFADWFAVSALFREVPIPILRRHTNIIVRERAQITESIADMVQNQWFTPEAFDRLLADFSASQKVLDFMDKPENRYKAITMILRWFTENLDNPHLTNLLGRQVHDLLSNRELARHWGTWIEKAMELKYQDKAWEWLIGVVRTILNKGDVKRQIVARLEVIGSKYKERSLWKAVVYNFAEKTGGIDYNAMAAEIVDEVTTLAQGIADSDEHPMRVWIDAKVLEFAMNLRNGEEGSVRFVTAIQEAFVEYEGTLTLIREILIRIKSSLSEQLVKRDAEMVMWMMQRLENRLREFRHEVHRREILDDWVREKIKEYVQPAQIGQIVKEHLGNLKDKELVEQIENKVGDDLQYIRLNGAIVGGIVGLILGMGKVLLFE